MSGVLCDQTARKVCIHKPKANKIANKKANKVELMMGSPALRTHLFKGERQGKDENAIYHCLAKCAMPSIPGGFSYPYTPIRCWQGAIKYSKSEP
jgi:hypothetical protein